MGRPAEFYLHFFVNSFDLILKKLYNPAFAEVDG